MKPLNPIMAVLVIASVGALPLRTLAADGNAPANTTATEDKNPVNILAKILAENESARVDAGKRAAEFLLNADSNGKSFVGDGVDTTALGAVARDWGESKGAVGNVAMFYFVAGPGLAAPGWALKDPILSKTFAPGMKWEGRLRDALSAWTDKSQIDKTKEKTQATAFLNDAAAKSADVFADARTKQEIDLSIAGNDNTATVVPDTRRSTTGRLDGATRQYTLDDLYKDGAKWGNIAGPNDPNSRTISMKIFTKRVMNGDGSFTVVNEIGIFDITDNNDIFGQRFPITSGDQSFTLDDRTPGHKKYELKFGVADASGNRTISFGRPDGTPMTTTVTDLFTKRADQAAGMGNVVKVGGQEFYVLPQGGAKGALDLFPKDVIDNRGSGDARDLVPGLYAEVGVRGPDGRNQNVPPGEKGGPHLGTVDGKDYHLEFNNQLGVWEVKPGAGDLPKPPAKPTTTDPNNTNPTNTDPNNPNPVTPGNSGEMPIADLETLLLKSPECRKNPDDIKDLADNLKGKYGIIACSNAIEGLKQIILVPKSVASAQQLSYTNAGTPPGPTYKLLRARFVDHYLVLQFDKQVQYLDLLKQGKDDAGKDNGFALSGFVADKNASQFENVVIFIDALKNYMGVTAGSKDAGAFAAVPTRLAAAVGSKPYRLSGSFPKDVLTVVVTSDGLTFSIWPENQKPGSTPNAVPTAPYTSVNGSGPTNAMDGEVSSVDAALPDKIDLPESHQAKAMDGRKTGDIALYESLDLDGKKEPKKYFIMFKFNAYDPARTQANATGGEKKVFRQKPFEVFNSSNPLPGSFEIQGLVASGATVNDRVVGGYHFVTGSSREKGVLAVFQNKQVSADNAKDKKANCVGPIVWWGVADRDEAQKVCENDKF